MYAKENFRKTAMLFYIIQKINLGKRSILCYYTPMEFSVTPISQVRTSARLLPTVGNKKTLWGGPYLG
jgi:hypothetical protein